MKRVWIASVIGLAALVVGWFLLDRPATKPHSNPAGSNGAHTAPSPNWPASGGDGNGPTSIEHPTQGPSQGDSRIAPTRPSFETFDDEAMGRFIDYLQKLWDFTAQESVEEIDAILRKDGRSAALRRIREVALATQHAGPRFEKRVSDVPFPDLNMSPSVLSEADFHSWFRAMLFARLIPHILGASPEPAVLQDAMDLLGNILTQGSDPSLTLYAAVCLSRTRCPGTPNFLRAWETRGGKRIPTGVLFDPLDGNKPQSPSAAEWQRAIQESLLPSITDSSAAAGVLMNTFRGTREMAAKYMILEGMAVSTHSQDYLSSYFDIMRDKELLTHLGSALLPLIGQNAHLPDVRRTIDAEIAPTSNNPDLRIALLGQLPSFYPSERGYADLVSALVRSDKEDEDVRTTAAFALTQYYGGQMRLPEYRDVIASFLREQVAQPRLGQIDLVTKSIEEHTLTEFIPVLEEVIREWHLHPPAEDPNGDKAAALESFENALSTLRETGK